jgi:undecaprenyl diphosphate synthase
MHQSELPNHIGLILDGNRRWAKAHGLAAVEGHLKGREVFKQICDHLFSRGVKCVSAYVFSTENWKRSKTEVDFLMNLVLRVLKEDLDDYHKRGVRISILGSRERLSAKVLKAVEDAESRTAQNTAGTLALCFNYGGRAEIVEAAKSALAEAGSPEALDEEAIKRHLWHPYIPDVDLVIRTSGEQRLSNFQLWRSAYAELYFMEKHWPEVTTEDVDGVLRWFAERERRFGGDESA